MVFNKEQSELKEIVIVVLLVKKRSQIELMVEIVECGGKSILTFPSIVFQPKTVDRNYHQDKSDLLP